MPTPTADNNSTRPSTTLGLPPPAVGVKRKRVTEQKFYAVRQGKKPGVYDTWEECLDQVKGHKGAICMAVQIRRLDESN